jgi:bifunctional non-homologous end joining protein LigD
VVEKLDIPRYEPMLATAWAAPFSAPGWWFELKWDGVRTLAYSQHRQVRLRSRRDRDVTVTYPEVASLRLPEGVVIDGEIVAFDESGRPSFELLQQRMNLSHRAQVAEVARTVPVSYVVFDLLYAGADVTRQPLAERRARLADLELGAPAVVTDIVDREGEALFAAVVARGLEGMVAKRIDSLYQPGRRSSDWRKIANRRLIRAVVGGYLQGEGARGDTFGSLLIGLWDGPSLRWIGAVGSGFDDKELVSIRAALDELTRPDPPFTDVSQVMGRPSWVEPGLVVSIEYKEWTAAGRLRAPVWKGVLGDPCEEITWEAEGPRR